MSKQLPNFLFKPVFYVDMQRFFCFWMEYKDLRNQIKLINKKLFQLNVGAFNREYQW